MSVPSRRGVPAPGGIVLGRNTKTKNLFSLAPEKRTRHMHVLGASGTGKSSFLETCIMQDVLAADGVRRSVTFIDRHGTSVERLLDVITAHRIYRNRRIRLLRPDDPDWAFALNPFAALSAFDLVALTDLITTAILQAWGQDRATETPLIGEVLRELLFAVGALGLPLADAVDFLSRQAGRERGVHLDRLAVLEPTAAAFWLDLERLPAARRDEYLAPVRRRLKRDCQKFRAGPAFITPR